MTKINLKTEKRTVIGKKVKKLRREGLLPINLYGKDIKSIALSAKFIDFKKVYQKARTTQVVYLEEDKKEYPALIQNVQIHPLSRIILHADFKKIDLKQKTEVEVPVVTIGELAVVKSGEADLMTLQDAVLVECLPTKIPEKITVDISKLEGIGSEVKVKDLPQSEDYKYLAEAEQIVIQIVEAKKEEIKAPEAAAPEEAPAEGEAAAEAEKTDAAGAEPKAEEPKKEAAKE
ncbi:hypothetical protein A2313_04950 [Candidatus Roizmanbacteria bacterium RIFOXYB2_FULL_41_10]|nr:MAG: hypothetical protein A2313_04950 [Candidatus Roizmanbacteria bacterium RIFOXYB2_FULL_41_10]OGK72239.1 MAG: hypothetical protein A2403_04770 [Candidatus Roizmanbacteria bacterium RIFOXYC1_FULL_41_16]